MQAQRSIICERIRERLDDVGWSALDLAAAVRTSEKTVYRWVSGEYAPRSEYIVSISAALDVSPLWLLGVTADAGPVAADVALRAARTASDQNVIAALEEALAAARARTSGSAEAPPVGGASG